jgi:antirestriction protein ArdC
VEPTKRRDCYSEITNAIIADLEKGVRPWIPRWNSGTGIPCRPVRNTGEPYRGINVLWLWREADQRGYQNPYWFTYRQAQELGAHVRKGEKSTMIVFADKVTKSETNDKGEEQTKDIPFLRTYYVFNVEQIEGLPEKNRFLTDEVRTANERNEQAEQFFANTSATILHGGRRAFYSVLADHVQMPSLDLFKEPGAYYATLAHEMIHYTGHPTRVPRKFKANTFGTANYAREELVAELGAAFLCADLGLSLEPRPDHADYIGSWLQMLRNDKRALFQAAAIAQKGLDFLHAAQPTQRTEPHPSTTAPTNWNGSSPNSA